jgi:XisI protein
MEKLNHYRDCIQNLLKKYASYPYAYGEVENELIFDTERDRYQLLRVGWEQKHRVYGCVMHFDIRDGKIWLQWNSADADIGQELMDMGISKEDLVIGFHPPHLRQYSDYAVG